MAATLTEALMGLGQLDVDLDYDAEILAELVDGTVLVLSHGEDELFAAELLWNTPAKAGIRIGGRGLDWRLGQDGDGPVILDREYLAGTNKLSNPGFELEDLYWRREESSVWTITAGNSRSGSWSARAASDPGKDDVLEADEGGYPTRPGDEWELSVWVKRLSGAIGRVRARLVFEGRFKHVGVFPAGTIEPFGGLWLNYSDVRPSDGNPQEDVHLIDDVALAKSGHWTLKIGPCTRKAGSVLDGSFESGTFDDWGAGDQWHLQHFAHNRTGDWAARYDPSTGTEYWLLGELGNWTSVIEGERWHAEAYFFTDPLNLPDGELVLEVSQSPDGVVRTGVARSEVRPLVAEDYRKAELDFEIDPGVAWISFAILAEGNTVGYWYADDAAMYRLSPNVARARNNDAFAVVPAKQHTLYANIRSGPAFISGTLRVQAVCTADGRPDVIIDGPTLQGTDALWQFVKFDFTPPSGYDECHIAFIGIDIVGDGFYVNIADLLVQYSDEGTRVYDAKSDETEASFAELTQTVTAPDGAERVQVELVGEDQADGWVVDDVNLHRVTASPVTFAEAVESLLVDPDTDERLLEAGTIAGDDALLYDLHVIKQANRDVLKHLCRSGVVSPVREFRVNPDQTLDAGTAEELFTDRTEAVLVPGALELLEEPTVERNWEDRVSDVQVVGAERQLADGRRVTIIGEAHAPDDGRRRRSRVIEDSTVDHKAYADALAGWHLDQSESTDEVVQLRLADWRASFDFAVGDWIYPWFPEAGLEDLDNEVSVDGAVAHPKRVRALALTRRLGSGPWRLELERADGTRLDISDSVRWEDATTADVTVGDVMPEFLVDPQGGAPGNQFLRYRASRPQ